MRTAAGLLFATLACASPLAAATIASAESNTPGITVDLVSLERKGAVLTLKWAIRNSNAEGNAGQKQVKFGYMGPKARTYLVDDMVLVRLKGALTVAEQRLATRPEQGARLVKQMRQELMSSKRPLLEELVQGMLGTKVRAVYTDISTCTGEGLIVLTLEGKPGVLLEASFPGQPGR